LEAEAAAFFGAESAGFFCQRLRRQLRPGRDAGATRRPRRRRYAGPREHVGGLAISSAEPVAVSHNDMDAVSDAIGRGRPWIAAEALYGMGGDITPLEDLEATCRRA
jgi:hypothetical protein